MKLLLKRNTKVGTFYIGQSDDGRFHPIYNDESLGSYEHAWQATDDLAMNATSSVIDATTANLLDTSQLGIPEDPSEWSRVK